MGFIPTGSPLKHQTGSTPSDRPQLKSAETSRCNPIVFVVDGDQAVCESLALLTRSAGWHQESFSSAEEFLSRPLELVPSCLILEVSLPGLGGLELQRRVAAERPYIPVIFLSENGEVTATVQAMKAGAVEFLTKPFKADVLLAVIREAHERSRFDLAIESEQRMLRNTFETLSHREKQVMALVVEGLLNKQVGAELGIREQTVKAHRGQVMQKMKADSFAELVKMATRLGLTKRAELQMLRRNADHTSTSATQRSVSYAWA